MNQTTAATHVRKQLAAATPGQLVTLGGRHHKVNGAPNYDPGAIRALRQALRAAGYERIDDGQRYISARTYAGLRRQKTIPRNHYLARDYMGIEDLRDVSSAVARSADVEAQGVFWTLVAGSRLDGDTTTYFLERWIRAGLALPKGTT